MNKKNIFILFITLIIHGQCFALAVSQSKKACAVNTETVNFKILHNKAAEILKLIRQGKTITLDNLLIFAINPDRVREDLKKIDFTNFSEEIKNEVASVLAIGTGHKIMKPVLDRLNNPNLPIRVKEYVFAHLYDGIQYINHKNFVELLKTYIKTNNVIIGETKKKNNDTTNVFDSYPLESAERQMKYYVEDVKKYFLGLATESNFDDRFKLPKFSEFLVDDLLTPSIDINSEYRKTLNYIFLNYIDKDLPWNEFYMNKAITDFDKVLPWHEFFMDSSITNEKKRWFFYEYIKDDKYRHKRSYFPSGTNSLEQAKKFLERVNLPKFQLSKEKNLIFDESSGFQIPHIVQGLSPKKMSELFVNVYEQLNENYKFTERAEDGFRGDEFSGFDSELIKKTKLIFTLKISGFRTVNEDAVNLRMPVGLTMRDSIFENIIYDLISITAHDINHIHTFFEAITIAAKKLKMTPLEVVSILNEKYFSYRSLIEQTKNKPIMDGFEVWWFEITHENEEIVGIVKGTSITNAKKLESSIGMTLTRGIQGDYGINQFGLEELTSMINILAQ